MALVAMTHARLGDRLPELIDELPEPTAYDLDGTPWWSLSDGQRVYARRDSGDVYTPSGTESLSSIEWDALAHLAAVAYARGTTHSGRDAG